MTRSNPHLSLSALLLAGTLVGCDQEPVDVELSADRVAAEAEAVEAEPLDDAAPDAARLTATPGDVHVVGHVSLAAIMSAPWITEAMKDATLDDEGKLGACADVLRQAESVTFGATKDEAFEAYLVGSFDAATANACGDHIDAEVARHATRITDHPKPEALLLADGVFVVFGGSLTPSRERLDDLRAADPSGGQPLWVLASTPGEEHPVEQVRAWANPAKGLRVHAELVFGSEEKAAEVYGKANLGLAAMTMSDEVGDLASAVDLRSSGKAITADVELTEAQMKTVAAKAEARHHAWHDGERHGMRFEVEAD